MANTVLKIRMPPGVSAEQLRGVVREMAAIEPLLRVQYVKSGGKWVKTEAAAAADIENIVSVLPAAGLEQGLVEIGARSIPLNAAPLCRFLVCDGYVLFSAHQVLPAREVELMSVALEITLGRLAIPENPDYPPSRQQIILWQYFLDNKKSQNVPFYLRIRAELTRERVRAAVSRLSADHEILRTRYSGNSRIPECSIAGENLCETECLDLSSLDEPEKTRLIGEKISAAAEKCLDLTRGPWRCLAIKCSGSEWRVLLVLSHICMDGWNYNQIKEEFLVAAGIDGRNREAARSLVPARTYKEYCVMASRSGRQYRYNRRLVELYRSYPERLLPIPHVGEGSEPRHFGFELPAALHRLYLNKCREMPVTPFALTSTAFLVTLLKWREQDSTAIRISACNRSDSGFFRTVGPFWNRLFLDFALPAVPDPDACLLRISDRILALLDAQDIYLYDLLELAKKDGRLEEFSRLGDISFDFHEDPVARSASGAVEEIYVESAKYYPFRVTLTNYADETTLVSVNHTLSMIPEGRGGTWKDLFLSNLERLCARSG